MKQQFKKDLQQLVENNKDHMQYVVTNMKKEFNLTDEQIQGDYFDLVMQTFIATV